MEALLNIDALLLVEGRPCFMILFVVHVLRGSSTVAGQRRLAGDAPILLALNDIYNRRFRLVVDVVVFVLVKSLLLLCVCCCVGRRCSAFVIAC